jgi:hypothetical protein
MPREEGVDSMQLVEAKRLLAEQEVEISSFKD